jgi:hypothetical protein
MDDRKGIIKRLTWRTFTSGGAEKMCELRELSELSAGVRPPGS